MTQVDGVNSWGYYKGLLDYFIPDTSLFLIMSSTAIFTCFLSDVKKLTSHKSTVKDFPIVNLGVYLVSCMFMFMFLFGNGSTDDTTASEDRMVDYTTSITESSTICLVGKVGYFLSMIWSCFYIYFYFSDNAFKAIAAILVFIVGSFLVLAVISLILRIPLVNRIIIAVVYTVFNMVPGFEIRKIMETHDKRLFNTVNLFGTFILTCSIGLSFCRSMKNYGFEFLGLIVIINFFAVAGMVGYYFYLGYKYKDQKKESNTTQNQIEGVPMN